MLQDPSDYDVSPVKSHIHPQQQQLPSNDQSGVNVRPYQKLYIQGAPGSCPPDRPRQMEDIAYEQKYGKGPLMQERAERLRRLHEV